jgi:hypothetical protein
MLKNLAILSITCIGEARHAVPSVTEFAVIPVPRTAADEATEYHGEYPPNTNKVVLPPPSDAAWPPRPTLMPKKEEEAWTWKPVNKGEDDGWIWKPVNKPEDASTWKPVNKPDETETVTEEPEASDSWTWKPVNEADAWTCEPVNKAEDSWTWKPVNKPDDAWTSKPVNRELDSAVVVGPRSLIAQSLGLYDFDILYKISRLITQTI